MFYSRSLSPRAAGAQEKHFGTSIVNPILFCRLIEEGMVRPSLDSTAMYTAVELDTALESALKKHEAELREMEQRKRDLEELARQQSFRPSDEVSTFKILKTSKEIVSAAIPVILHTNEEFM